MSDQSHDSPGLERMTVGEASKILGISESAVRKRVERGKMRSEHTSDGRLMVYLDMSETVRDKSGGQYATIDRDELIAELRARIEDLRTDRDAWRDQARRSDYMASAALDRTRELESRLRELEPAPAHSASSEARGGSEATTGDAERVDVPDRGAEPEVPHTYQRPWWRRVFGERR